MAFATISVFWVRDALIRKWQQRSAIKISVFKTFQVRVAKKLCDSTEARPPKKSWDREARGGESKLFECLTFWHRRQILARHRAGLEWRLIVSSQDNRNLWTTGFKMDTGLHQGHCHLLKVPYLYYCTLPNLIFLWTYIRVVLTRQFSQMEDSKVNFLCRKLYPRLSWRSFHLRFIHWGNG